MVEKIYFSKLEKDARRALPMGLDMVIPALDTP